MQSRVLYVPKERKRRRRFPKKLLWGTVILLGLVTVATGGYYLVNLEYWRIKEIRISGLEEVAEEEFLAKTREILEGRYYRLPQSSLPALSSAYVSRALENSFPRVKNVRVAREFPDTVRIQVEERKWWAILCNDAVLTEREHPDCVYIDKEGFAIESAPFSSGSLVLRLVTDLEDIQVGREVISPDLARHLDYLKAGIAEAGAETVEFEFSAKVPGEISARAAENFKIIFRGEDDFENAFGVLKTVLEEEIGNKRRQVEYIDLRFGNKVFYKMR